MSLEVGDVLSRVGHANPDPDCCLIFLVNGRNTSPGPSSGDGHPHCDILCSDGRGSWTNSGSRDGAVHNPPEILALEPELHLVNPDVVIGPIKDGDCYFDIVGGSGRHVVDRFLKRSLSARDLFLKKKLKEN